MAKNKSKETDNSVADFLSAVEDSKRSEDYASIIDLLNELSGFEPKMWGTGIVGFGIYNYKYESAGTKKMLRSLGLREGYCLVLKKVYIFTLNPKIDLQLRSKLPK
ncbi:hypothetical protein CLU83_1210 [Flavobacterium sp. 1]|uniref:hypothetical protein n=1 Tax=Flavobacterium sp. 1 TaxID=2035200 RepID=UPI000C241FD1|nr:hypothetical protein [Flavobacterium sp. 1]PJJ07983.1 hypothetical protein CLU83_1210 [Flavobacterium sp. 1]